MDSINESIPCADYVARLEGALAWLMTYRNTTVIPPLAVLRTMNEIRVAAGEPPYPLRCEECCGPLDADGWHQSEFADCSRSGSLVTELRDAGIIPKEAPPCS